MNLIIDKPISKIEEDKLGRCEFAKMFAKMLITNQSNDGIVVLLNGEWGSGKTSIVNLVKYYIQNDSSKIYDLNFIPVVHDFSPWNVVTQDGIISQFFDTFSSGFSITKIRNILKTIKKSKVYKMTFKTLNYVSAISSNPAWKAVSKLKKIFDAYVDSFNNNKNLLERKNEIINILNKSYTRHIVFIDDLDRLNDSEIRLVIQLIKSVCNFPNVIYVLSADSKTIQSALKSEQSFNSNGDKYLEKIIQATFDVPNIKEDLILDIAYNDLDFLFKNKLNEDEVNRFQIYRYCGMFNHLKTIRDEKRFINMLKVTFDGYKDELDIVDFIAISYLKFVDPKIIQLLCDYIEHLFGKFYPNYENPNEMETRFRKELSEISRDDSLLRIIKEIFPRMFTSYYDDKKAYLSKRICSRNRFNLYLTGQLDSDDLSINRFKNAIYNKKYEDLVAFNKTLTINQGRKFLLHLVNFVSLSSSIDECDFIARFLLNDFSSVKVQDKFFLARKDVYVRDFIKELCKKYSPDSCFQIISKYINENSDICALSEFAIELNLKADREKHFYGFSEKQIEDITSKTCNLILNKIKSKTLLTPFKVRAIRLLFENNKDSIINYFIELNDLDKIRFISELIWIGTMTDNKRHLTFIYSLDWISDLVNDDELNRLINNLFGKLNNYEKQRILVLKMQKEEYKPSNINGEKIYLKEDIEKYCEENKIIFVPSDAYEKNNTVY